MRCALLITLLCFITTVSYAEHQRTVGTYKKHIGSGEHTADLDHQLHHMLYLTGIGDTYFFLNKEKESSDDKVFYCQPKDAVLTGQDYKSIFEKYIYSDDSLGFNSLYISEALLRALQVKYPCP